MPSSILAKYRALDLQQVYMLGHWNYLHLPVRTVVSSDRTEDAFRVL
jgi:hypothetical protein